jgi:uncharacterized protein YdhG (YjbR/CyaY superfamily)
MTTAHRLYMAAPDEHRQTMLVMRDRILELLPQAHEVVSYGMPAFRIEGGIVAGMLANKKFVGYYPLSGSILSQFPEELASYSQTKSALQVPLGKPLSKTLLRRLVRARVKEIAADTKRKQEQTVSSKPPTAAQADAYWQSLGLSAPARRALAAQNIRRVTDLKRWSEADLRALHGMGPHALSRIDAAMKDAKVTFKRG